MWARVEYPIMEVVEVKVWDNLDIHYAVEMGISLIIPYFGKKEQIVLEINNIHIIIFDAKDDAFPYTYYIYSRTVSKYPHLTPSRLISSVSQPDWELDGFGKQLGENMVKWIEQQNVQRKRNTKW